MAEKPDMTVTINNAQLPRGMRNFKGAEGPMNQAGSQNFCVLIDPETAELMKQDGWNVKQLRDREVDGEMQVGSPYIQVQLGWKVRPPHIIMIDGLDNRQRLGEEEVEILDDFDFTNVDMIIRARYWERPSGSGIKAYLQTAFFTIQEDELMQRYGR